MSYTDTFISVAEDCPAASAQVPPPRTPASVAELQYELLTRQPYALTEEDLYVLVHALRRGLSEQQAAERRDELRAEVYARPQACLRASALTKRYGFGAHYDAQGRIAIHPREGAEYARLAADPGLHQLRAMRASRRGGPATGPARRR